MGTKGEYFEELSWADYLNYEISEGNVTEETDVDEMHRQFIMGLRGEIDE